MLNGIRADVETQNYRDLGYLDWDAVTSKTS